MTTQKDIKVRLSASSASSYKQCPRKWEFRYIHKLPDPPGIEALVGNFMHSVLEDLMQLPEQERTQEQAKLIARKIFDEKISQNKNFLDFKLDEAEKLQFRRDVWNAIAGLWDLEDPKEVDVLSTELRLNTELNGINFLGFIDRVDNSPNGIIILDYKTGKFPTNKNFRQEKLDQVFLYAAAYEVLNGSLPAEVKIYFTNPMGKNNVGVIAEPVTRDAVDTVVEDLTNTHSNICADKESGAFEPISGPLCGWCPYINKCQEGTAFIRSKYEQGNLKPTAPAIELLGLTS